MNESETGTPPQDSFVDLSGSEIGPYRLLQAIGRGGMSTVYQANDRRTESEVALKVLHPQLILDRRFPERFKREASVLRRLEHPHIVPVLDYGQEGDLLYLAMPWMRLGSLSDRLAQRYLSPNEGARLISQIAEALDYAHQQGVIHRDVKPGNILINHQGNALLSDFGFVHLSDASMSLTGSAMVGTPAYISPEQALGDEVTPASDQYALAVILYQLTTGMLPYEADTPIGMAIKHATQPMPSPRSVNPNIPNVVETVLEKALNKDPGKRYDSILAFNQAFQDALVSSVDLPTGSLKRGAIRDEAQTLELSPEEMDIPSDQEEKRKRRWLPWIIPLVLILMLCPAAYWAYRYFSAVPGVPVLNDVVQPTANITQTAESIILALAPVEGTGIATQDIQTAVAGTLAALPTQTLFPTLDETGTFEALLAGIKDRTEDPGSPASPTRQLQGGPSATPPPRSTSTTAPEDTSTPEPTATRTITPIPSNTPIPTDTPTPTMTDTPIPSDTPSPTSTNTPDVCSLIDYQTAGRNGQEFNIRINNNTSLQIQITNVYLGWPGSNDELKKVELAGSELWSGEDENPPTSFSCSGPKCNINPGSNKVMTLFFGEDAASSGYTLRLTYTNGCVVEEGF
jgi:serine/threonine-protein kinase